MAAKKFTKAKFCRCYFGVPTKAKRKAAEEWCRKKGWGYKVITQGKQIFYNNNFIENSGVEDSNDFEE